jgi:hypothetical protein
MKMAAKFLVTTTFLSLVILCGGSARLDNSTVELSIRAMELFAALQTNYSVSGGNVYVDGPNAALSIKEDNHCFVVFDSTHLNIADWWQNLDPYESEICSPSGICCTTRNGFRRAVTNSSYTETLENNLRTCMNKCPDCEAIITGQSQGGAIATVFAVTVEDIHPTIIAFGTPASIIDYCPSIDVNKYYRFLNTVVDEQGNLKYDPVPYFNMEADQRGHLFIMGDDRENVVYYGDGSGPSSLTFPIPLHLDAHQIRAYLRRMRNYHNRSGLGTDGW